MRVLIVEDDVDMLRGLRTMLSGHDVVAAHNGMEALRCLGQHCVDVIVSDIVMPVMDGLTLCDQLKRNERYAAIPFVFLAAGYSDPSVREKVMQLGAEGFLAKPSSREKLLDELMRVVGGSRRSDPVGLDETREQVITAPFNTTLVQWLERQVVSLEQQAEALLHSEGHYRDLFEQAAIAMWVLDNDGYIRFWNAAATRLLGYEHGEVVGWPCDEIVVATSGPLFEAALARNRKGQPAECELQLYNVRRQSLMFAASFRPVLHDGSPNGFIISARDITASKLDEAQLYYLAYHDRLTDLPNRTLFVDRLHQALLQARRTCKSVAVLFLDVDCFKQINDTYGHAAGDELLTELSHRIRGVMRAEDSLARAGGDEFFALISDVEGERSVGYIAQKLLYEAEQPFNVAGHEVRVSLSVGISLYPQDAADAESLINFADSAMYKAKAEGRNRFHYYSVRKQA